MKHVPNYWLVLYCIFFSECFGDDLLLLLPLFWTYPSSVFLSLKNLKTLKITTFRWLDLPSSSGEKGGDTYSAGSGRPSYFRSVDHRYLAAFYFKTKDDQSFETQWLLRFSNIEYF
jgi:hypothetical protein